ncbi:MAG: hypothetical protein E7321_01535 [Clostridiales bacterium]|nr:hypothetical protein [Clostridiales bacterium]
MLDLKENFDPYQIDEQLEVFCRFAKTHSCPMKLMVGDEPALRLNKEFWYNYLCFPNNGEETTAEAALKRLFDAFFEKNYHASYMDLKSGKATYYDNSWEKFQEELTEDIRKGNYYKKVAYIAEGIMSADEGNYVSEAIRLLAICELSEFDAMNYAWGDSITDKFTVENELVIKAREEPYCYRIYEDPLLSSGLKIRTVKIMASGDGKAVIELMRNDDEVPIDSIVIKGGEYRYMNVAGNYVIDFLPDVSISDDQKIEQFTNNGDMLRIYERKNGNWQKDWDLQNLNDVSAFSTGGKKRGFLLIQNGRLIHRYYNANQKIELEMIDNPVVDVLFKEEGYMVLDCEGRVYSDFMKTSERYVSLEDAYDEYLNTENEPEGSEE